MITNQKEIEIEQLHDLHTIALVDLVDEVFNDGHCLSLSVTYGENESIRYNYTEEYFPLLLSKLVELYIKSENKNKIVLVGENTKNAFKDLEILYNATKINKKEIPFTQTYPIIENNTKKYDIDVIKNIVTDLGKSLLFLDTSANESEIKDIIGYRERWIINYTDNGIKKILPINIHKNGKNYVFKVNMIDNTLFDINGSINFYEDTISVNWIDNNTLVEGKIDYSINKLKAQNIIKYNNKIVGIEKKSSIDNEKDQQLLYFYTKLYDFKINNYNSFDNLYFGLSDKEENNYHITQNSIINVSEDLANIKIKTRKNIKFNNTYSFFFENEDLDIVLRTFVVDDKKYVLEQINYLPTMSTGEYKYFYENRYNYKIYEIDNKDSLNKEFHIKNEIKINEEIHSIEDVENIIRTNKEVKTYGTI